VTHSDSEPGPLSRRAFLKGAGGVAAAGSLAASPARHGGNGQAAIAAQASEVPTLRGEVAVELRINGATQKLKVQPRTTLLDALRTRLEPALTGTKDVCGTGSCGACTVLIDGQPAYACLSLAATCVGREVTTVEGLGTLEQLSDVQRAFCEEDGAMCGFCTPGFIVASHAALARCPAGDLDTLKVELSGNLCRCGTYPHIFNAVTRVQAERAGASLKKDAQKGAEKAPNPKREGQR